MGFIKGMINAFKKGYNEGNKRKPIKHEKEPTKQDLSKEKSFIDLKNLIENSENEIRLTDDYFNHNNVQSIILNKDNLIIDGNNHVIDACSHPGIFFINGDNITIKNLIFKNTSKKPAIQIMKVKCTLINCTFEENNKESIENNGKLYILDSTFKNNKSYAARKTSIPGVPSAPKDNYGTILNKGCIEITGCKFINNSLGTGHGTAMFNMGNAKICNSNFRDNDSNFSVIVNTGELEIKDSNFTNNSFIRNMKNLVMQNVVIEKNTTSALDNTGNVTISNSKFKYNARAIVNKDLDRFGTGKINISNSQFIENRTVHDGAAIYNISDLTIEESIFENNSTSKNGGAIFHNSNYILEITNSKFINNESPKGSSIFNGKGEIKMTDCEILNHQLKEENSIICNCDVLNIYETSFLNNQANSILMNMENGILNIIQGEFTDNSTNETVIYNMGQSSAIYNSHFENNTSKKEFSANIINASEFTAVNLNIHDNNVSILNLGQFIIKKAQKDFKNKIHNLGEILTNGGPSEYFKEDNKEESRYEFDFTYLDNLIHSSNSNEIILNENIIIARDEREFYEGGIELDIDDLVIDGNNNIISGNNLSRIFLISAKNVVLKNIIFKDGLVFRNYRNIVDGGGAIDVKSYSTLTIENCQFIDNFSESLGGSINNSGKINIHNTQFKENDANYGGAINNNKKGNIKVFDSKLINNSCKENGGAIHNFGMIQSKNTLFMSNNANLGGAIYNEGYEIIANTLFLSNSADNFGGALFNYSYSKTYMNHSYFSENNSSGIAKAIYVYSDAFINIENSNFVKKDDEKCGEICSPDDIPSNILINNTYFNDDEIIDEKMIKSNKYLYTFKIDVSKNFGEKYAGKNIQILR